MSRVLSAAAIRAALAQETDQVFLVCLTVSGPGITTFRVVNDTQDLVRAAGTFIGYPFEIVLPDEDAEKLPSAQVRISNVSRDIIGALRGLPSPATVTLEVVLASSPDTVEFGPFDIGLLWADYDVNVITFNLGTESILSEPFPAGTYDPQNYPGLF